MLIARATGAEGRGAFALAIGTGSIGALYLGFRWQRPVGYFLAKDSNKLGAIAGSILLICALATGLGLLLWKLYPSLLADGMLKDVDAKIISLSLLLIAPTFLWQNISALYGGLREFGSRTLFLGVASLVQTVQIGVLYLLGTEDVATYLKWQLVACLALYLGWLGALLYRRRTVPRLSLSLLPSMAKYSSFSYMAVLLDLVMVRLDMYLLNYLTDIAQAGLYSVPIGISNQMGRIPTIFATVIFNRASASEMGAGERTAMVVRIAFWGMLGVGAALGVAGTLLVVPLCGPEFAASVPALYVMLPATVFLGLFRLLGADIEGRGRPGLVSCCSLLAAVLTVALDFWWIPDHGIMGAAWASFVSYLLASVAAGAVFCRVTNLGGREAFAPRRQDFILLLDASRGLLKKYRRKPQAVA